MKIETENAKNGITSTVNLALHRDLILKTPREKLDQTDGSEKNYIWRDIMKAATFFYLQWI